jgi:hypothetical protein
MRSWQWLSLVVLALGIATLARYLLQRQESAALRAEIALLEHENRQVAELRAEHERLLAAKISDAELERLRNDRAALNRLRAEIAKLEEDAERKSRALKEPTPEQRSGVMLKLELASDGALLVDGTPMDQASLRQCLAGVATLSVPVEIRFRLDPAEKRTDLLKTTIEGLVGLSREVGLKMSMRFDKAGQ